MYVPACCIASKPRARQEGKGARPADSETANRHNSAMTSRALTPLDRLLVDAQNALSTLAGKPLARRPNPAGTTPDLELDLAVFF